MTELVCPVQPVPTVSQGFRPANNPGHEGVDLAVPTGTPVLAPADGVISWFHPGADGDAGIHINIDHDNGYHTREFHLASITVSLGDRVTQGQVVAYSNNTGASTGPHLHYEVHYPKGNPVDPAPFLVPWVPVSQEPTISPSPDSQEQHMARIQLGGDTLYFSVADTNLYQSTKSGNSWPVLGKQLNKNADGSVAALAPVQPDVVEAFGTIVVTCTRADGRAYQIQFHDGHWFDGSNRPLPVLDPNP